MIGRLQHRQDFERVLATAPCARSAHFALHHLHAQPNLGSKAADGLESKKICTGHPPTETDSVDNIVPGHWCGSVIPKRHARRAVTRNLLRRQIRAAVQRYQAGLDRGLWLVRLRQPFSAKTYASADSRALRAAVASELDQLLAQASR
jgi:ribonuclease P protein component